MTVGEPHGDGRLHVPTPEAGLRGVAAGAPASADPGHLSKGDLG